MVRRESSSSPCGSCSEAGQRRSRGREFARTREPKRARHANGTRVAQQGSRVRLRLRFRIDWRLTSELPGRGPPPAPCPSRNAALQEREEDSHGQQEEEFQEPHDIRVANDPGPRRADLGCRGGECTGISRDADWICRGCPGARTSGCHGHSHPCGHRDDPASGHRKQWRLYLRAAFAGRLHGCGPARRLCPPRPREGPTQLRSAGHARI